MDRLTRQRRARPVSVEAAGPAPRPFFPSAASLVQSLDSLRAKGSRAIGAILLSTPPGQVEGCMLTSLRKYDCYE